MLCTHNTQHGVGSGIRYSVGSAHHEHNGMHATRNRIDGVSVRRFLSHHKTDILRLFCVFFFFCLFFLVFCASDVFSMYDDGAGIFFSCLLLRGYGFVELGCSVRYDLTPPAARGDDRGRHRESDDDVVGANIGSDAVGKTMMKRINTLVRTLVYLRCAGCSTRKETFSSVFALFQIGNDLIIMIIGEVLSNDKARHRN